jgi:NosR/NirI family transcriptional regulator, nitrous oxide reductase regulator
MPRGLSLHTRRNGFTAAALAVAMLLACLPGTRLQAATLPADQQALALSFFPGADRISELEGTPPAAAVFRGNTLEGYVFLTDQVVRIPAYSGEPISVLVGFDVAGEITGVRIVAHQEPILVVGITEDNLAAYVNQYTDKSVFQHFKVGGQERPGYVTVDGISGATITVMVLNASIARAARTVATSRGIPLQTQATTAAGSADSAAAPTSSGATPAPDPMWMASWEARSARIWGLAVGLFVLTLILILQDWLAWHESLLKYLRLVFLIYTLVFIGWYALAQLSVINVLTFVNAFMSGFRWETFLIEPLTFILWSFVAVTLLLWGRGVYCGWLCPFGALQELANKAAVRLGVRQFLIPALIHERLLAIKYIILLGLFGLFLQSMQEAVRYAEVEPFKTAITLRFQREWPFVAYALALVVVSLFNSKFFCKYLCPLGAALTIPSHFRIFDWLRRHKECGRPCQTCAVECPSQAIRPTGEINANECHHCLDCQVTYWNAYKCPPMVERRKRSERRGQPFKRKL